MVDLHTICLYFLEWCDLLLNMLAIKENEEEIKCQDFAEILAMKLSLNKAECKVTIMFKTFGENIVE